jgi:hypothetical protein
MADSPLASTRPVMPSPQRNTPRTASVQAQQLAHQVQHFAQHKRRRQAAAHELHHLAHEQEFLGGPVGGGVAGVGKWAVRWHGCVAVAGTASKHRTRDVMNHMKAGFKTLPSNESRL